MIKKIIPFLLLSSLTYSQRWKDLIESTNGNFYDVQQAFYEDWKEGMDKRAYGYKRFKRIEHYFEPRVYPTGEIKSFEELAVKANKDFHLANRSSNRSASWQPIGPKDWNNVSNGYNPGNGRVNSIVVHPTNSQIIYIATSGGGVWKTTNGGTTWSPLTDTLTILETSDIILDPSNPNTILVASGDNDSYRMSIGLYKSIDGGNTWNMTLPFTSISNTRVGYIEMDPANSALVYCATNRGMYRSIDTGSTWTKLNSTPLYNIKVKPGYPETVYATNGGVILKSIDSGANFSVLSSFPVAGGTRLEIETNSSNPDFLYVLVSGSGNGFGGFYLSKDAGVTWETMDNNTSNNILGYNTDGSSIGGQGYYDLALEVNPTNPGEIIIGGINVWKSTDTGKNWVNLSYWYLPLISTSEYTHADIHYLNYYGSILYCGSDGGIFTSTDNGFSWNNLSKSIEITEVYDFYMYKPNSSILSLGAQDNGTFVKYSNWTNINGADGFKSLINQSNPNQIIYSIQYGEFYYTNDGGTNKIDFFNDLISGENASWETPIDGTPNIDTVVIGHNRVWATTDAGNSWNAITTSSLASTTISNLKMAPSNSSILYGGDGNELYRIVANYTTNSSIITDIRQGLPYSLANISDILIHPENEDELWVSFSGSSSGNKVFYSDDGGSNWTNVSGTLPNTSANCLAYSEINKGIYVGMDAGIYYMDTLITWTSYYTGMPNAVITKIIVDELGSKVKASTFGRGIWESDGFYGSTVTINNPSIENELTVFPNPATDRLNVRSNKGIKNILLLNIAGHMVKNVASNNNLSQEINIDNLAPGTYFIRVSFNEIESQTRTIMIYH